MRVDFELQSLSLSLSLALAFCVQNRLTDWLASWLLDIKPIQNKTKKENTKKKPKNASKITHSLNLREKH